MTAQESLPCVLPSMPSMRRVVCRCGCGRWFYVERQGRGRKREFANPDCYRDNRNRRRRARWAQGWTTR